MDLDSAATGAWLADGVDHSSTDGNPRSAAAPPPSRGRRRARKWRWVALGGLLVVVAGAAYHWTTRGPLPPQFVTAPVTRGTVAVALTATGTVNPVTVVEVGTYVSGPIVRWYCNFNTSVKVGQLCAQIDPRPFQMVADQAAANLAVSRAQLIKDQASLAYARTTYERDVGLLQRGIVSQATLDSEKSAYEQAAAQITYDQSAIQERQAELSAAQVNLGYAKIISPVNGIVVSRNIEVGQTVAASFQTPILFLIATDLTKMQGPMLSYTPDLFGRDRRFVEQQGALAESQRHQLAGAYVTLTASVATQAITIAATLAQIMAAEDVVAADEHNLELVRIAYEAGSVARTDVLSAESQLAGDRTLLPPLRQQLKRGSSRADGAGRQVTR